MAIFIETTEDGSPTAHFENFAQERMHHSGGAFGETVYIYGPAIQFAFSKTDDLKINTPNFHRPKILSLGTGLGYNEILTAAFSCLFEQNYSLDSYEANPELNTSLRAWVFDSHPNAVPFSVYDTILKMTSHVFEIPQSEIKKTLQFHLENQFWNLNSSFDQPHTQYNAILYDFFSRKAMEHFWTEDYLHHFFKNACAPTCAIATYACTGALKRSLKNNDLEFIERKGYLWKRTSTFAKRVS